MLHGGIMRLIRRSSLFPLILHGYLWLAILSFIFVNKLMHDGKFSVFGNETAVTSMVPFLVLQKVDSKYQMYVTNGKKNK